MSQRAVFVRVNGDLIQEIFNSVPDYDEMIQICKDNEYEPDEESIYNYYLVEYEWVEIGEGESATDSFIDEETLLAIYDSYDWEKHIHDLFGLNIETVETGNEEILFDDLQEEDCDW